MLRRRFLGVEFDCWSMSNILDKVFDEWDRDGLRTVVTPNADHIVRIVRQPGAISEAYANAWICVNDSRVVEHVASLLGLKLEAVPGADLVVRLFEDPRFDSRTSILLVGGNDRLANTMRVRYDLRDCRQICPPMGLAECAEVRQAVVKAIEMEAPEFIFLAVGSPQQELIAETLRRRGRTAGVAFCVGAALHFLSGEKQRAPRWMSRIGAEWLFRLGTEPRRLWRRYLGLIIPFGSLVAREMRRRAKVRR
jgi:N-acetylglucosaminyldiphosphoundecaprenol N-acetyl-beta-D-mannosaminyltransferase